MRTVPARTAPSTAASTRLPGQAGHDRDLVVIRFQERHELHHADNPEDQRHAGIERAHRTGPQLPDDDVDEDKNAQKKINYLHVAALLNLSLNGVPPLR